MKPADLVIVWSPYNWEERGERPWQSTICPVCAQTMCVGDDGKIVDHMRAVDAKYEDDTLCTGAGKVPESTSFSQLGGTWGIVARQTGRNLGYFKTVEDARAKLAEMQRAVKGDVTPPGREEQVRALKEKPGIDNPYAVAWASYNKGDATYDGARCDACEQDVPVTDGHYDAHVAPGGSYGEDHKDATMQMCDGSGAECRYDVIEHKGGKYVLLAKSTGKVLGTHATREEAEAQERAVQASKHGDGLVKRWERIDFAPSELPRAKTTADGFLQVVGRVARTGIQEYRDGQGGIRRELRLPDEVKKSLPTFPLQPLTNTHPADMVSPTNAQQLVKGAVGAPEMGTDGWVTAPMTIYAQDAIAAARGGRVQLSVGYTCRLEDSSGEWQGQRYDAVQRDIVVNHVALVDMARAGTEARLRLDEGDAVACDTALTSLSAQENVMNYELKIGGMIFKVDSPNAQAAYDQSIAAAKAASDGQLADAKREAANEKARADGLAKEKDGLQGKLDGKLAEDRQPIKLDGQEIPVADAADPVKFAAFVQPVIEARAAARAQLVVEARKHLGSNVTFDAGKDAKGNTVAAKSDGDIKRLVVAKLKPSIKLDGKSDEYVNALYDDAVASAARSTPTAADLARSVNSGMAPVAPQLAGERADNVVSFDPEAARQRQDQAILRMNARHPDHKKGA